MPATKHLPKRSLGLIGKYLYLMVNKPDGKNTVMHFDYMVVDDRISKFNDKNFAKIDDGRAQRFTDGRVTRVSLSNIYKEFKNVNGSSIQIPLTIQPDRWVVVCINVSQLFDSQQLFPVGTAKKMFLRSF